MNQQMKDLKKNIHKLIILVEDIRDQVKIIAKHVVTLNEKYDRRMDELERKIDDNTKMMGVIV